jgi:hypothetical protein
MRLKIRRLKGEIREREGYVIGRFNTHRIDRSVKYAKQFVPVTGLGDGISANVLMSI